MTIITASMDQFARAMFRHARTGHYDGGNENTPYFNKSRRLHRPTGTMLLFTRDVGHHTSGWFKNPDYERCYHLSVSFWDLENNIPRPFEPRLAASWCRAFYGGWIRLIWEEGPVLRREPEVRHYRVFCDPAWQPILPRKEVYTREFTEKGWKSWSDLHAGDSKS